MDSDDPRKRGWYDHSHAKGPVSDFVLKVPPVHPDWADYEHPETKRKRLARAKRDAARARRGL